MKHKLLSLLTLLSVWALPAATPTLDVTFDHAQKIKVGDQTVEINGEFTPDGYLKFGKKGIAFPAGTLLGTKGTVLIDFRVTEPKNEIGKARGFVTLRNAGRLYASIYTLQGAPRCIFAHLCDYGEQNYNPTFPGTLENDKPYMAGFSYDGTTFRLFLNGKQVAEQPMKVGFDDPRFLFIGPYIDHMYDPPPWDDDCQIHRLRVYNEPLSVAEVFAAAGGKSEKLVEKMPPVLTVPAKQGVITLDGKMDEEAWQKSASLPFLIDAVKPERTWEYPENRFNLTYDNENLYLGTRTVFPRLVEVKPGALRDAAETDVWGFESWEFYLIIKGKAYRFGGNVAGGYVEWLGKDASFNAPWTYKSSYKMRIDDRFTWESESAIPWKSLGLDQAPKSEEIQFNYCRSWFLPDLCTYGSLTSSGDYIATAQYPVMKLTDAAPTVQSIEINNPTIGTLEEKLLVSGKGKVKVEIQLANQMDLVPAKSVFEKELELSGDKAQTVDVSTALQGSGYDLLIYTLSQDGKIVTRELVPFFLVKNYLKIAPNLLKNKVEYSFNQEMFKSDFPNVKPEIQLILADGKVAAKQPAAATGTFAFDRQTPAGNCALVVADKESGKQLYACTFLHPGIGEWEKMVFDNRIIPPLTPQVTTKTADGAKIAMWGRVYTWKKSLFPVSITSQGEELLAAPMTLEINGKALANAKFVLGKAEPHRTEFTATAANDDAKVKLSGWLEYDGVSYNKLAIHAKKPLQSVKIKTVMPEKEAQFLHTSLEYYWGNKITEKLGDNYSRELGFFPVMWLGEYEKGLCLFTEQNNSWNNKERSCISVRKADGTATVEWYPCMNLAADSDTELELGILASPVKALPANYPLNTFADHHMAFMNRPGKTPVTDIMLSFCGGYDSILGDFFCDIPNVPGSVNGKYVIPSVEYIHKRGNGRSVPYLLSRTLSEEYPEIKAYVDYWRVTPGATLDYNRENIKYLMPECCPVTEFSAFHAWKILDYLKRIPTDGIYLDGAICGFCNNKAHGCNHRIPLLAQREFYRRVILVQLMAGIKDPVLVLHNTDSVQLPAFTFATHLFNGEQIRQDSSTMMHNGKDILDTYDATMFASELGSLPFGITNSVYQSNDVLSPRYGGDPNEDPELYKFRITKPMLAGALVHGTMPSLSRCHFGLFDKVIRAYDAFDVKDAKFTGYWKHPAQVENGKDIFVSVYQHKDGKRALAVISHLGKEHIKQNCRITFDLKAIGLSKIGSAKEYMSAEDKEYDELYTYLKETKLDGGVQHQIIRTPLKWGNPGVELKGFSSNQVEIEIDFHSFALVELAE